ncbi:MAG: sigma-70 family RNA polymerase sigma factor [Thermoguttaceae bacterium]|nr:sigma-70 family RNA polymerase sigma factor [Thermoguttaceae bacterium]
MTQQEFERYADVAKTVARRFAAKGANVDYDDLFQDACLTLLEQEFDRARTDGQIRGYLTKRVYFRMLDRFRAATRWRRKNPSPRFVHVSNVDEELFGEGENASVLDATSVRIWRDAVRRESIAARFAPAVEKALKEASQTVRLCYLGYYVDGETMKSVGVGLGLSESRVSQILSEFRNLVKENAASAGFGRRAA